MTVHAKLMLLVLMFVPTLLLLACNAPADKRKMQPPGQVVRALYLHDYVAVCRAVYLNSTSVLFSAQEKHYHLTDSST